MLIRSLIGTMLNLKRGTSENSDFQNLVIALDQYLAIKNGETNAFYSQYNGIAHLQHVVVAYEENMAVGCGAIKAFDDQSMEVKRMFVPTEKRGKGIASLVLADLEQWAKELGYSRCL